MPEQKDTVKSDPVKTETEPAQFSLNDTVVPKQKDTVTPEKKSEGEDQIPADTLTPAKSL